MDEGWWVTAYESKVNGNGLGPPRSVHNNPEIHASRFVVTRVVPRGPSHRSSLCLSTMLYFVYLVARPPGPEMRHSISLPIFFRYDYRGSIRLPRPRVCQDDMQLTCRMHATDRVVKALLVL